MFMGIAAAFLTGAVFILLLGAIHFHDSVLLRDVGAEGEACYPNGTCMSSLTCFEVREEQMCLRDVKTVLPPGAGFCFEYTDKDGEFHAPCLKNRNECLRSFGQVLQSDAAEIKRGCHHLSER